MKYKRQSIRIVVATKVELIQSWSSNDVLIAHRIVVGGDKHKTCANVCDVIWNNKVAILLQLGRKLANASLENNLIRLLLAQINAVEPSLSFLSGDKIADNLELGKCINGTRGNELGILGRAIYNVLVREGPSLTERERDVKGSIPRIVLENRRVYPAGMSSLDTENSTNGNAIITILQDS